MPPLAPGPRLPLFGALIGPGRDPLKLFTRLAATYGDVVGFTIGGERVFFINHPQHIRDVLVTHQRNFTKSRGLERAKKLLGEGLLTSEGATHLRRRRLIQPAFHRDRVAGYASVMSDRAARMRARWIDGATLDVSKEMMRVTLAIVAQTLFDSDVESQADEVGVAVTEVLETFWYTLLPFQRLIDMLPLPVLRRGRAARARLDALIYAMIADRRATGRDHGDLLSMLLAARDEDDGPDRVERRPASAGGSAGDSHNLPRGLSPASPLTPVPPAISADEGAHLRRGLSPVEIRDEAMTLLLAGHETTANALTWTWYLLSQSPEVEARLHAEIDDTLHGRLPTAEDVGRLNFVERVVTESMRLFPPAWVIGRRAIADYAIGGYHVPARSVLFMSPYVMQRDRRFFPEPERFLPDRWTPEFKAALPKFAYFPFGGGARQCIGEHFAWMELVLLVATIAQAWRLRLVPNHPVVAQPLITLRAKHGMMMTAAARPPLAAAGV
jgi:cytochrome P450